jgi:two-component system sensor histidine kinase DegS
MKARRAPGIGMTAFERSYVSALGRHVRAATASGAGNRMGRLARRRGVPSLRLARIHERAAAALGSSGSTARMESFFAQAVRAHRGRPEAAEPSARIAALLEVRTRKLSDARRRLAVAAKERKGLAAQLDASARRHSELADESRAMERRLRSVSHRLLAALEAERLRISRDLHDAIGETLAGINVGLATLKNEAASKSRELADALTMTQRLVERSMKTVHQFAWELRPTLLDDLGLVPALRSYAKAFSKRTGIVVHFAADARFEGLAKDRTVALFRVAQGALSNVERHARARRARIVLRTIPGAVRLEVADDGRSFDVQRVENSKKATHLGLLVMKERVEMVAGAFSIVSTRGRGTTVRADVPSEVKGTET